MKHAKQQSCIVIYTTVLGHKNYIAGASMRPDNKLLPQHHTDLLQAKPFSSQADAEKYIARIINHSSRLYCTETAVLPAENFKAVPLKTPA